MRPKSSIDLHESWRICFFLGLVMLNFPFLHIFNKATLLFGIPLMILYLFIGWPLSIAVVWLFSLLLSRDPDGTPPPPQDQA